MTIRNLEYMFRPRSIAVLGASNRPEAKGSVIMDNLLRGGFNGPIMPIDPDHLAVKGVYAYRDVESLPQVPELAVIAGEAEQIPDLVRRLGVRGTKAAIVIDSLVGALDQEGHRLNQEILAEARRHGMRLLGPDSVGVLVPHVGLNASFAHCDANKGKLAFVSQSSALCTAVLDWAEERKIGFSHFVALGEALDVDFADMLDYLGGDGGTTAILLYIEHIEDARKFISAARAAARNKPVLAIKTGRGIEGKSVASPDGPSSQGADEVYESALRRAGILRVRDIEEMFQAVETLSRSKPPKGDRMAIIANSGAIGMLAADALLDEGGKPADLAPETVAKLDAVLPRNWSRRNPLDILLTAGGERYAQALSILLEAPEVDSVLVMHAPGALTSATEVAMAVAETVKAGRKKPVATCWIGGSSVQAAREMFGASGLPTYDTPEAAVAATMHLIHHRRSQEILTETPSSKGIHFQPDTEHAKAVVRRALAAGQTRLNDRESKEVVAAYGIPTVPTALAADPEEAAHKAQEMGLPVALKIWSEDITRKSDVGGVVLDLTTADEVRHAAEAMRTRVSSTFPQARIKGFLVQPMSRRTGAQELVLGVADDAVFGPVLVFGHGGTAVDVLADRAVALPPLNMNLARDLISQTRISRLLEGYADRPAADVDAIGVALCRISQMLVDIPQIRGMEINPLLVDSTGILALDVRVSVAECEGDRLAIRPYPKELEEEYTLEDGRVLLLRPIRPEDEPAHHEFHSRLSDDDIRFRHFGLVKAIPHVQMARLTQIDYDREMAIIATHGEETFGVARIALDPNLEHAEFAIIIRSDLKGLGIGSTLLDKVTNYCRDRGVKIIAGETMRENKGMIGLAKHLGFKIRHTEDGIVEMVKVLHGPGAEEQAAGE